MGNAIEKRLIFPAPESSGQPASLTWDEQPRLTPGGGVRRPFLWVPSVQEGRLTVIHFHANAEDLFLIEDHLRRLSVELCANILGVEYPGYGPLQGARNGLGSPSIDGIDASACHALQYIVLGQGIPPSQVLLYGRSLGCGPALKLARRARDLFRWGIGGIVLQSPFISIKQLAVDYVGRAASMLVPDCYDNLDEMQQLCGTSPSPDCPVNRWIPTLLLHGKKDTVVQPYHSEALHRAARAYGHPAVELAISEEATHDYWDMQSDLITPIAQFLQKHPGPRIKDAKVVGSDLNCANVMCSVQPCHRDRDRAESVAMAPMRPTQERFKGVIQGF
mmetsp:Transcript_87344/g.271338  ORF Transcript_87344/g.271338 Transcript_87344/m.271338 type:complete len:333 (-) Transcript_87344:143-1141(-)